MIDFIAAQLAKFDALAEKIQTHPEYYLAFDSVSDFYKAEWLEEFPKGTTWMCTGLDDGAEDFDAVILFRNRTLNITVSDSVNVRFVILNLRSKNDLYLKIID